MELAVLQTHIYSMRTGSWTQTVSENWDRHSNTQRDVVLSGAIGNEQTTHQALSLPMSGYKGAISFQQHPLKTGPLVNVCICHSLFAGAGDVGRYSVFTIHDHGEGLAVVGLLEGGLAAYQHEQDHTQTPDIQKQREGDSVNPCEVSNRYLAH